MNQSSPQTLDQLAANLTPPKVTGMDWSTVCDMTGAAIVIFLLSSGAYAIFRYRTSVKQRVAEDYNVYLGRSTLLRRIEGSDYAIRLLHQFTPANG